MYPNWNEVTNVCSFAMSVIVFLNLLTTKGKSGENTSFYQLKSQFKKVSMVTTMVHSPIPFMNKSSEALNPIF